jgi:hypothetical protein
MIFLMILFYEICERKRKMIFVRNEIVKIKGRCVFLYLLAHYALAVPQGPGPPLHVERSSSGHFPPPRRFV